VGGELIRLITSCPRVVAPVVRRRFFMRPGDRCAVAVFQWWDQDGEAKRRPDVRFLVRKLHGSVQGQSSGGGGRRREGGGVYVPNTLGEQLSSSPPVHVYALVVSPVSSSLFFFHSSSYCGNRATIEDVVVAFRGTVWAYQCIDCTRLLLKHAKGMEQWRSWAQEYPRGSPPAVVASLPVVSSKQGAGVLGIDANGTPRGLCDSCSLRRKRTARQKTTGPNPCAPPHPPPPHPGDQSVSAHRPSLGLIHAAELPSTRLPPLPPTPSRGDATAGSSLAPPRLCGCPLSDVSPDAGAVNLVAVGACPECGASAVSVRLSGERESAAQLALPRERFRDATLVPDAAAAGQQHPGRDAC